jgi:hypothetical protein
MGFFSAIGNLFGGSKLGADFEASGINADQLNQSIAQNTGAYQQQNDLAQALASQGQQGMQAQSGLAQALQAQAMGMGPNPAAAQLANQTGNNIASQAALMAGQRGAGSNVGLMARQAAQQGGAIQQNAVGQNAVLQAQQQLAAQKQLQDLAASQIGQQTNAVGNLNNFALQNQGQMFNMQANQNQVNAGMAAGNAANTAGAIGGLINAAGGAATMGAKFDGGIIEGEPKHDYDTPKNDTVPTLLTPKEIVLPLSVTQAKDAPEKARAFVEAILKKEGKSGGSEHDDFKKALKEAIKSRKK